jgi:hypothetical protein
MGSTFLTRLLLVSTIYKLPSEPAAILTLAPNTALSGDPPSPPYPVAVIPPPAQVLIFPAVVTRRTA